MPISRANKRPRMWAANKRSFLLYRKWTRGKTSGPGLSLQVGRKTQTPNRGGQLTCDGKELPSASWKKGSINQRRGARTGTGLEAAVTRGGSRSPSSPSTRLVPTPFKKSEPHKVAADSSCRRSCSTSPNPSEHQLLKRRRPQRTYKNMDGGRA